jgi:hypothetical protein
LGSQMLLTRQKNHHYLRPWRHMLSTLCIWTAKTNASILSERLSKERNVWILKQISAVWCALDKATGNANTRKMDTHCSPCCWESRRCATGVRREDHLQEASFAPKEAAWCIW